MSCSNATAPWDGVEGSPSVEFNELNVWQLLWPSAAVRRDANVSEGGDWSTGPGQMSRHRTGSFASQAEGASRTRSAAFQTAWIAGFPTGRALGATNTSAFWA